MREGLRFVTIRSFASTRVYEAQPSEIEPTATSRPAILNRTLHAVVSVSCTTGSCR